MDRWLEIDFDWFGPPPNTHRVSEFVERALPLWSGVDGDRGVVLNVGWLVDVVTEWTGDPRQKLPLRSRRYRRWADCDYLDLRGLIQDLKLSAQAHGIPALKVGIMIAGLGQVVAPRDTGAMYDLYSNWYDRHPELYPLDISDLPGPDLDPRVPLRPDGYEYASRPGGVREGDRFADLLAGQWASLAQFSGLDLIHLRDGFFGPMLYSRRGPYGTTASPDPRENSSWTDELIYLIRQIKAAAPGTLVMAYSSGISRTAEWRVGCVDLRRVVAESGLDVWIDQTWGGAWQDWWDDWWKGWTYQHAYLLGHGVALRQGNQSRPESPCRHYKLIETWDGWEPWDTIHRTPGKLEWAMWAFSHASVLTASGPRVPEGSYISWMNDWDLNLLSEDDIHFLSSVLDQAESSANDLNEVYGPIAVFNDETLTRVHEDAPRENVSEWLEDHLAMLLKWGTPVLGASTWHDLPSVIPEGVIAQITKAMPEGIHSGAAASRGPLVVVGRADWIDERHLDRCGVRDAGPRIPAGYTRDTPTSRDLTPGDSVHLPDHRRVSVSSSTDVRYQAKGNPLLAGREGHWYWQPPDLVDPGNPLMPRSQIGTVASYVEATRMLAEGSRGVVIDTVPVEFPVTVQVWRSGRDVYLLAGNLESGWVGDSRTGRTVAVTLPRDRVGLSGEGLTAVMVNTCDGASFEIAEAADRVEVHLVVPPSGCALVRLWTGADTA